MKIYSNIEFSHVKEVVISHKVFYIKNADFSYSRDDERTDPKSVENNVMPDCLSANEMAGYVRDYVGLKKWKIVSSEGSINIFKKGTTHKLKTGVKLLESKIQDKKISDKKKPVDNKKLKR
jgi:hypothetical protein